MSEGFSTLSTSDAKERDGRIDEILAWVLRLSSGVYPAPSGTGRVVFLESADHLPFARRLRGHQGMVFTPGGAGDSDDGTLRYEGAFSEPGDELLVGDDVFVYTQDYLATPFLAVAGPTVVRICSAEDYSAFLQDADLARDTGLFVEQLQHPSVFLADQCALGTTHPCAGMRRVQVSASGAVKTAPGGKVLGNVESDVDGLWQAERAALAEGDPCLAGALDDDVLAAARARRPWLSRYLRALDVLRGVRASGYSGLRISGFGGRIVPDLPTGLVEASDAPLLLWNDDDHLLCDPVRERVFQLGPDAARLVELLLVTGSAGHAEALATTHLGMSGNTARAALRALAPRLADTGVPTNVVAS